MKRNKTISLLLIVTLLCNYLPIYSFAQEKEEEKKITIAVYELSAKDVSPGMVSVLSDVLRDAIFQTGKFEMLTKEDMQRILENMAEKQQVKPDCDSDACIAEIAGALGVEMMITGSIGIVGKTYVINLRLIDTDLAKTKNTASLTCPCAEDVLIERVKEAGLSLLKIGQEKPVAAPAKKPEPVAKKPEPVKTLPQKAAVELPPTPRQEMPETTIERKSSKKWLWWTLGILVVAGGGAAAAGGGGTASSGGGGGGDSGGTTGGDTGTITVRW